MADDDKPKKSASEKLYDRKKPEAKKAAAAEAKPEPKPEAKPAASEAGSDTKPAATQVADSGNKPSGGAGEGEQAADPVAEMRTRHEQERRDLHNSHRKAYRGMTDFGALTSINRQHERAIADMNMRHEAEAASGGKPAAAAEKPAEGAAAEG